MSNPYTTTQYEETWSQGYSYGYYNPDEASPSPPLAYSPEDAQVYLEGVAAGQQAGSAAATGAGDSGLSGNAGGAGFSGTGTTPSSSDGPTPSTDGTIPEVTIYGDPNAPADPNSGDDAYADGYSAGYYNSGFDDSAYAEAVKPRYSEGYNAGYAAKKVEGSGEHHEGTGEVIAEEGLPHLVGEAIGHLLGVGFGGVVLGAVLGGPDTMLKEAPAYMAVCHRSDHGLSGDAVMDGGAWHSEPTMDYNAASSYGGEHGSTWGHGDDVHIWEFKADAWSMF
jgi:hypothetical protein